MNKSFKYFFLLLSSIIHAESIVVDANLDEAEWEKAYIINEYYETVPYTLTPAEVQTVTKIISNKEGIYIGFTNYQENDSMLFGESDVQTESEEVDEYLSGEESSLKSEAENTGL